MVGPDGQKVGHILHGHKKVMAIKSSTFQAMFYGPLKEDEEPIMIEETTFEAFNNMFNFLHDIEEDWSRAELPELLHTANLAERYNLPKMKLTVLEHIKSFTVTEDNLLETAATAEKFSCLGMESEVLLQACSSFLEDSLVTPGDLQKFIIEQSTKDDKVGIRLLARVKIDELTFVGSPPDSSNEEKVMNWKILSISKKVRKSSNTRGDLIKLKDLFDELANSDDIHFGHVELVESLVKSLVKSIDMDKAAAAVVGNQVQPEAVVEESITHLQSVQVHLDLIKMMLENGDGGDGLWLGMVSLNNLWDSIVNNTVPEVHDVFFDWLIVIIETDSIESLCKGVLVAKLVLYPGPRSASYHGLYTATA